MRWCWVVLAVSGCFDNSDDPHGISLLPPVQVVQHLVIPPFSMSAEPPVTLPVPRMAEGDLVAVVVASTGRSDAGLAGVTIGETNLFLWNDTDPGCGDDVITVGRTLTSDSSSITLFASKDVTVEVGILELTPGDVSPSTADFETSVGVARSPTMHVPPGAVVLSTVSVCTQSVRRAPSSFISLGLTSPGVDAVYAVPDTAQVMGAQWSFEGTTPWAANTLVVAP